jgi:Uma2 family endonuclease
METTRPLTETYLLELEAKGARFEVVNRKLAGLEHIEMAEEEHGWIETKRVLAIGNFVVANKPGRVYPGDTSLLLDGNEDEIYVMREPDVVFVKAERLIPTQGLIYMAPDLAVEITSPSQSYAERSEKIEDYLAYGTEEVWLVLPNLKKFEVYRADKPRARHGVGQSIPGGTLLPGLTLNVSDLFDA